MLLALTGNNYIITKRGNKEVIKSNKVLQKITQRHKLTFQLLDLNSEDPEETMELVKKWTDVTFLDKNRLNSRKNHTTK